jgi:photosystem II stability/assembly factor-like uncharacterized protein
MKLFAFFLYIVSFGVLAEASFPADPPNIYRSTDQGENWTPFAEGLPEGASAGAMLEHEGRLLLGTDFNGFYVLSAGAQCWESRNIGLPVKININSVAAKGDIIVIGTYHGRVYTSRDAGRHWQSFVFGFMGGSVRALYFHGDILIAGTDNGIYRSFDKGTTWHQTGDLVQVNSLAEFDGKLYAARRDGIVVSEDDGKNWSFVYSDRTVPRLLPADGKLYGFAMGEHILRTKNGELWEQPLMVISGASRKSLPAALWGGLKPSVPGVDMPVRSITETSTGWFLSMSTGC